MTSTGENAAGDVPGLLDVLAPGPGPAETPGRRYLLVSVLAIAGRLDHLLTAIEINGK